ncbi:uncharacterized protein [Diadema setosum]|uniref:uncharacterized protein n=1 Tax=Diadema setosum TaxID=31175 RepID=UPI003B3B157F
MKVTAILVCLALVAAQVSAQSARPAYTTEEEESQGFLQAAYSWFVDAIGRDPREDARSLADKGLQLFDQGYVKMQEALSNYEIETPDIDVPTFDQVSEDFQAKLDEAKTTIQQAFETMKQTFEDALDVIPSTNEEPPRRPEPTPQAEEEEQQGFLSWFI